MNSKQGSTVHERTQKRNRPWRAVGFATALATVLAFTVIVRANGNLCFPLGSGCLFTPTTFNLPVEYPSINFDYSPASNISYDGATLSVAANPTIYFTLPNGSQTSIAGDQQPVGGGGAADRGIVNILATVAHDGKLVIADHDACGEGATGTPADFCMKGYVVGSGSTTSTVLLRGVILNFTSTYNHPVVGFRPTAPDGSSVTMYNAYDYYIKLTGGTLFNAADYPTGRLAIEVASPLVWNNGGTFYQATTFYCGDAAFKAQYPGITQWVGSKGAAYPNGQCGDGTFNQPFGGVDIIGITGATEFLDGMLQFPPPADVCNGTISGTVLDGLAALGLEDATVTVAGGDLDAAEQRVTLAGGAYAVTSTRSTPPVCVPAHILSARRRRQPITWPTTRIRSLCRSR